MVTPSKGVNSTATIHDTTRNRNHHEQRECVFACVAAVETNPDEEVHVKLLFGKSTNGRWTRSDFRTLPELRLPACDGIRISECLAGR
jgi:hypothetical protein